MDNLIKMNLANVFRKQESKRIIKEFDLKELALETKSQLQPRANPFLVDDKYALKLDDII